MDGDNFEEFIKKLKYLEEDIKNVGQQVTNRAINEGMAVTVKATPKNKNPRIIGGTLQKGWMLKPAQKTSTGWKGEFYNNVEYGLYVNFGHRLVIKGKTVGYIPGKFFLEAGVEHMKRNLNRYFASEIKNIRGNWK